MVVVVFEAGFNNRAQETGEQPPQLPSQQQISQVPVPGPLQARRSAESLLSTGMADPSSAQLQQPPPAPPLPRLYPEGGAEVDEPVFDCIVYLIFCPEHCNLAVGKVVKCGATWLPFVALGEGVSWADACAEGVTTLIGRTDAEADAEEAEAMTPTYSLRYLHLLRVQLPVHAAAPEQAERRSASASSSCWSRAPGSAFRCCQNSDRVDWLPLSYIYASTAEVDRVWGPELWVLPMLLSLQPQTAAAATAVPGSPRTPEITSNPGIIIRENSLDMALYYLEQQDPAAEEHRLLKGARLSRSQVLQVYADYVEHCWPAFYMCFEAFRAYLLKYGHPADPPGIAPGTGRIRRLFAAFCTPGYPYVDFHCFLLGLVAMEPAVSSSLTWRLFFLFRYYTATQGPGQQTMNGGELAAMLAEAHQGGNSWSGGPTRAAQEAEAILLNRSAGALTREAFIEEFQGQSGERLFADLCRHPKSILLALAMASSSSGSSSAANSTEPGDHPPNYAALIVPSGSQPSPSTSTSTATSSATEKRSSPRAGGTCWSCRRPPPHYEYGTHYVTLGGADGRCVEARLMQKVITSGTGSGSGGEHRRRYSLECVFTIGSVPNIFMDLIRDFFEKQATLRLSGLLSTEPEWPVFAKYKLLRVNGPAAVVGALGGSLRDLLAIQRHFYPSFPVVPEAAFLFLGDYSGEGGFSVEVLVYLLSLKIVSPNKVFLLRGRAELVDPSGSGGTSGAAGGAFAVLRKECQAKYGPKYGAIVHGLLVSVFAVLPIAALVDDSVLCTHSGIPAGSGGSGGTSTGAAQLEQLLTLPNELPDLGRECPAAYEIITRAPAEKEKGMKSGREEEDAKKTTPVVGTTGARSTKQQGNSSRTTKATGSDISIAITCSEEEVRSIRQPANSRDENLKNLQAGSPLLRLKPTFLNSLRSRRPARPKKPPKSGSTAATAAAVNNCPQLPSATLGTSTITSGSAARPGHQRPIVSIPFSGQDLSRSEHCQIISPADQMWRRLLHFYFSYSSSARIARQYAGNVGKPLRSLLTPLRLLTAAYVLAGVTRLGLNSLLGEAYRRYDLPVAIWTAVTLHHTVGLALMSYGLVVVAFDLIIVVRPHPLVAPMLTDLMRSEVPFDGYSVLRQCLAPICSFFGWAFDREDDSDIFAHHHHHHFWTSVFIREHAQLLVDLVIFNRHFASPLIFWHFVPALYCSVFLLCLLYFFPLELPARLVMTILYFLLFVSFILLSGLSAIVKTLYGDGVDRQLFKLKLMAYYEVLRTRKKVAFTFGSHAKLESKWLWEMAVKNASKKFLSPERDKELYGRHFDTPLKKAAELLGVQLHHFGGSIKKITSTVRNLQVLQQLIETENYRKAASFISTYSSIIIPVLMGDSTLRGLLGRGGAVGLDNLTGAAIGLVGEVVITLLAKNDLIGPLVAAKLHLVVAAFSLGIYLGFALYLGFTFKELYELKGAYDKAKAEVEDPAIAGQLSEISAGIHQLEAIENHLLGVFKYFEGLKEAKNFDLLLEQVQSKVEEANEVYLSTSKKIGELNVKLNELKATMACSKESSETTAKVSYGVSALSCAASAGALLVPGLNLVVAGTLVAGSIAALGTCAVGAYLSLSFQSLIRKVAELQGEVDARRGEMDLIKGRIDGMLKRAQLLKDEHLKEADPEAYVSDSELADFEEDGE
ncbi:hypothetical protein TYRP_011688 [Tyrophagus putrescentiae]|nr:hypothetical protein TYRP_011688 [Tyrophagus putrescentiae]